MTQVAGQLSPSIVLPSSQVSPVSITPLPHTGVPPGVLVDSGVGVTVGVPATSVLIAVAVPCTVVAVGVAAAGQLPMALLTPLMSCEMVTIPLWSWNDTQVLAGCVPSAMLTPMISSLIATLPSLLQSPTHCAWAAVVAASHRPAATSTRISRGHLAMNRDVSVVMDRTSSERIGIRTCT